MAVVVSDYLEINYVKYPPEKVESGKAKKMNDRINYFIQRSITNENDTYIHACI